MTFSIVNHHDPYHMEADDLEIAAVAVTILGGGKFTLKGFGDDLDKNLPSFVWGGRDAWFTTMFGCDYKQTEARVIETRADALARAFESVTLQIKRRKSIFEINKRAAKYAKEIRKKEKRNG